MLRTALLALLFAITAVSASFAGEIRLSAGAGMKDVVNDLADQYSAAHPGTAIIRNWGPSGAIAVQIENGAPTDLFISANEKWVIYLRGRNLLDNSKIAPFAWNPIVLVGNPASGISSMKELPKLQRIAIGNPKAAPAGEMAMEAIRNARVEAQLEGKVVYARDILESLMYAESGAVDASFVHLTEALTARKAKILFTVPRNLYTRVPYTMAVTRKASTNQEVIAFYNYLKSPEAKKILKKWGYELK